MARPFKGLFLFLIFCFIIFSDAQAAGKLPRREEFALDFKLQDLAKNTYTLSSYRDKQPVILFFWTTWCPYCRRELKNLEEIYPQLAKEGWQLLAIDAGEPPYKVENFLQRNNLTFKVLLDKDMQAVSKYKILGVPTYVVIDKTGRIVFRDNYFPQGRLKELISE